MAEKIIITTDAAQKTIENINPAARNNTLAQFGEKIAAFTNGQYLKTDRVFKINCDTEPGGGIKPEPTLELSQDSIAFSSLSTAIIDAGGLPVNPAATITTNSDGHGYIYTPTAVIWGNVYNNSDLRVIRVEGQNPTTDIVCYIGVTETENFAAKEVAFTITA